MQKIDAGCRINVEGGNYEVSYCTDGFGGTYRR